MPSVQEVEDLKVPRPKLWYLSNGAPVYETNMGTQEIVKLELVFFAGRPFERKKLAARATAPLMKEGTKTHSSAEIAETMDFYGATLAMPFGMDTSNVQLYSLTKHFDKVLPLLAGILSVPTFPQKEIDAFIHRNQQRLQVELTKNDVLAYRKFTELLYGKQHPYGYNSYPETYGQIKRADLVAHFEENFTAGNCLVFLSGKINPSIRRQLEEQLGKKMLQGERRSVHLNEPVTGPENGKVSTADKLQKAIRIGRRMFGRKHEDYNGMYVLNTILGGYFGSRLMANIREKKGYTYSIYSSNDSMLFGGYFSVASEVGNEFVEDTIKQVYIEMEKLQTELIGPDELSMVRNYLLGTMLTNLDGPFNIAGVVKTFAKEGMPLSSFEDMVETIKNIKAEELRNLARKYFGKKEMVEVVV